MANFTLVVRVQKLISPGYGESENHPLVSCPFIFARQLAASRLSHSLFIPAYSEAVIESGLWCMVCGSCAPSGKTILEEKDIPDSLGSWGAGMFLFVRTQATLN